MIKAIKTNYNGKIFRSRLESNVAFLLDSLNIKWLYEPISFLLSNGVHYNPDFYLIDQSSWMECRGYKSNKGEVQLQQFIKDISENKIKMPLQYLSNKFIVIKQNPIYLNNGTLYNEIYISQCSECNKWQLNNINDKCFFCQSNEFKNMLILHLMDDGKLYINNIINNAEFTDYSGLIPLEIWLTEKRDS